MRSRTRAFASNLDMYRKVPLDLLEGTKRGSVISYGAVFVMITLFFMETWAYLGGEILETDVTLDRNEDAKLRVNINITMMDLRCDYATVDMISPLGTSLNVTSHLSKFSLDAAGVRDRYRGRNTRQSDIILSDSAITASLEELHEDGVDAVSLTPESLAIATKEASYVFIDFYASWCSHCMDLAPTWETLAETMTEAAVELVDEEFEHLREGHDYSEEEYKDALKVKLPVMVAKIDCVEHKAFCFQNSIWAYPTLRLYIRGAPVADYQGDRTLLEMVHWLAHVEEEHKRQIGDENFNVLLADELARELLEIDESREDMIKGPGRNELGRNEMEHHEWAEKMRSHRVRQSAMEWRDEDHPGCQISGFLWVDRVPGNFHIQARSPHHDIDAKLTNVSHEVHHLSFGDPGVNMRMKRTNIVAPKGFERTLSPLDGNVYVNENQHEAFHHYLKVVTTEFNDPYLNTKKSKMTGMRAYQVLSSSQLSYYRDDIVPEAKFSYDPSPIAVYHRQAYRKRWYDYLTSLMAIIGGTFTVIGMIENTINAAVSKKRR